MLLSVISILRSLYRRPTARLNAFLLISMRELYELLQTDSPYQKGDMVHGRVYEFSDNFGTFIAVDDRYSGMIPPR